MDDLVRQRLTAITSELDRLHSILTRLLGDARGALAREDPEAAAVVAEQITHVVAQISSLTDEWADLAKRL
jgi:hypothetical protein